MCREPWARPTCSSAGNAGISRNARSATRRSPRPRGGSYAGGAGPSGHGSICIATAPASPVAGPGHAVREEMAALLSRVTVAEVDTRPPRFRRPQCSEETEGRAPPPSAPPIGIELVAFWSSIRSCSRRAIEPPSQALRCSFRAAPRRRRETWRRVAGADPGARSRRNRGPRSPADPTIVADPSARRRILGFPPFGGLAEEVSCTRRGGRRGGGGRLRAVAPLRARDLSRWGRRPGRSSRRSLPMCSATRSPRSISPAPASGSPAHRRGPLPRLTFFVAVR